MSRESMRPRSSTSPSMIFFFLMIRPPPRSTLFPYPTLFRSDIVGADRHAIELLTRRGADRRNDRRRARYGRRLADPLGAVWRVGMRILDELGHHRRHVERRRQQVIGEGRVAHEPVAKLHLLHHREPEALCDAAFDLTDDGDGIDRLPDVLRRRDLNDLHEARVHVDVDDGAMRREEKGDVALVLRLWIASFGVAVAMRDRLVDRLVKEGSELVG